MSFNTKSQGGGGLYELPMLGDQDEDDLGEEKNNQQVQQNS